MEKLKKERAVLRRIFTTKLNEIKEFWDNDPIDEEAICISIGQLEDKFNRLDSLDQKIKDLIVADTEISEEDMLREYETIENYRDKMSSERKKLERLLGNSNRRDESIIQDEVNSSIGSNRLDNQVRRNFKLPILEPKKFDGDVKNWIGFWGQFKKIHNDNYIDLEDKFQYLLQSTEPGSAARTLVESFPPSGENYEKALH